MGRCFQSALVSILNLVLVFVCTVYVILRQGWMISVRRFHWPGLNYRRPPALEIHLRDCPASRERQPPSAVGPRQGAKRNAKQTPLKGTIPSLERRRLQSLSNTPRYLWSLAYRESASLLEKRRSISRTNPFLSEG